jgi:hypothetical protein
MMYRFFTVAVLAALVGASSCITRKKSQAASINCDSVACTMMFASVTVQVMDAAGNPAVLDSTTTLDAAGKVVYKSITGHNGHYTVLDDSYRKELAMRTAPFIFVGYQGGKKAVEAGFTLSADCCHVSRSRGPEVVTLK